MSNAVIFDHVSIGFKGQAVLTDFSHKFCSGQTYYIAGANGSGKSVLLKLICRFLKPDTGVVELNPKLQLGKDQYPLDIGAIIDRPGFIGDLSGRENLQFLASFRNVIGKTEIAQVMERVGLDPAQRKKVKDYSLGMKQRLALAQAVMERPQMLLLDEAFNALDDAGKQILRELIGEFQHLGATIILTSHSLADISGLNSHNLRLEDSRLTEFLSP